MARMRWLIGLIGLGVFSKAQSIGGPLGQAAGRRRGVRRRHLPRPMDRRRAAANVELSVVIPSKDASKQITDLLESLTNVPLATEIIVDIETLREASNYAMDLVSLKRFEEAKNLLLKTMPVAQRVLGEGNEFTIRMRWIYAGAIYEDDGATLDDVREAVEKLEETTRTARRVLGGANPLTTGIERSLRRSRAVLAARETPSPGA